MVAQLNAQDILEKQFKKGLKGYNVDEVDSYLNIIIDDYEFFEKMIADLTLENQRLQKELQASTQRVPSQPTNTTNFDILKRLSNLEKHVFGNKLGE